MLSRYRTILHCKTALLSVVIALASTAHAAEEEQPLKLAYDQDDFSITEAMVPMRDGVSLYTVIISPKKNPGNLPVMLKRTPYDASGALASSTSTRLDVSLGAQYLGDDYIYIFQDVRGRFKSEGDYFMYRVPRGEFNKTGND
jgi:hypothetical protein